MMLPSFPAEERDQVSRHARDWLAVLPDQYSQRPFYTLKHSMQILVGLWICEKALLDEPTFPATRAQAIALSQYMATYSPSFADLLTADPPLVLLSMGILRALSLPLYGSLQSFTHTTSQLLQSHQDTSFEETYELFANRFLLSRLDSFPPLSTPPMPAFTVKMLLEGETSDIERLIAGIIAATSYGQLAIPVEEPDVKTLFALLPIVLLASLRAYQLELGMGLLRCMRYLGLLQEPACTQGFQFLLLQQQPSGKFGFLANEVAQQRSRDTQNQYDLFLSLPLTVSFLWTIAEITCPQFLLCTSF